MASGDSKLDEMGALGAFGAANGLQAGPGGYLPKVGTLLTKGVSINAAVRGTLPGGIDGTIALLRYEVRSDDHTVTKQVTALITKVPESIGFAPYLSMGGGSHLGLTLDSEVREIGGISLRVAKGVDESWLVEVMAPTMIDWLSRSPDDFGFEFADGVLVVVRDGHISDQEGFENLCADATKLATVVRKQAIDDAASGRAAQTAVKEEPDPRDLRIEKLVPLREAEAPKDVAEATADYQSIVRRVPVTYIAVFARAVAITIGISVIAGGIYGLLLTAGDPLINTIIWEGSLFLIVLFFTLRSRINNDAKGAAEAAFWTGYARSHKLAFAPPLEFAATHAEADLPGKPVRVLEGAFTSAEAGTVTGSLMLTGDGLERDQWIALVAGPRGPTAKTELKPSQPGISAAYLDATVEQLLLDIVTTPEQLAG